MLGVFARRELFLDTALSFESVTDVINRLDPAGPVYCVYPRRLEADVRAFIDGFPGRVMYAVKANPDPHIVEQVLAAGVTDVDAASIEEMRLVHSIRPGTRCWFMAPVRMRGAAREAYERHGVRDFVVDHADELQRVAAETEAKDLTIFVRMAALNPDATYNLSEKFGAGHDDTVKLLADVAARGMQPALAFNTGSLVRRPSAYVAALERCEQVLADAEIEVPYVDVGGGFPSDYPGMKSEPLASFFETIDATRRRLPRLADVELLAEPGRALIANGLSVLTQVLHRKDSKLYLTDGVWGSFIEPVLAKGELRYPCRVYRGTEPVTGDEEHLEVFGPTCDSMDRLPVPLPFPAGIRAGDWIEFGTMGAYSVSNRTHFNGFFPNTFIEIRGEDSAPPEE